MIWGYGVFRIISSNSKHFYGFLWFLAIWGDFGLNLLFCIFGFCLTLFHNTPKPTRVLQLVGPSWTFVGLRGHLCKLRGPLWAFVQSLITSVDLRGVPPAFSKPSWLIFGLVQGDFCLQKIFFQAEPESCRTVVVFGGLGKYSKTTSQPQSALSTLISQPWASNGKGVANPLEPQICNPSLPTAWDDP